MQHPASDTLWTSNRNCIRCIRGPIFRSRSVSHAPPIHLAHRFRSVWPAPQPSRICLSTASVSHHIIWLLVESPRFSIIFLFPVCPYTSWQIILLHVITSFKIGAFGLIFFWNNIIPIGIFFKDSFPNGYHGTRQTEDIHIPGRKIHL